MKAPVTGSLPRSLVAAMILQFAVGGAVLPFMSLFFLDRGLDYAAISRIYLVASASLLAFPFLWGMLADRLIPLNRLFTGLNLLGALALWLLVRQTTPAGLLLAYTMFHACFNPTLMLVNPLSFPHLADPREQFGRLRAWGSLGWMLPSVPVFVWFMSRRDQGLDWVLGLGSGLALVATAASFSLPHTAPGAGRRSRTALADRPYWPALGQLLRNADYLAILASFFLIAGSFAIYAYYSAPQLERLGLNRAWIGPVQCVGVVLEIFLFRSRSSFVGRSGYANSVLAGCLALTLRQAFFAFSDSLPILIGSYLLIGVVVVFYYIGASILVESIASPEVKSTAQTLLVLCGSGLGPMFANGIAGLLTAAGYDLRAVFLFGAVLSTFALLIVFTRRRQLERHHA